MATQKTINKFTRVQLEELKDKFFKAYREWEHLVEERKSEMQASGARIKGQKEYLDQLEKRILEAKENLVDED